ncbi:hypothetical protein [Halogranum rubrum]|nr:hypothetical protein [Halogranum salarium]
MTNSMSLGMTERREPLLERLQDALDEPTKSKALDKAAEFTLRMRGNSTAVPVGAFVELIQLAEEQGHRCGDFSGTRHAAGAGRTRESLVCR